MAIVQISQIKHRRGVEENLPQLASAELGWAVDTQQLYIGNGTLAEGAPEVGNTRILTENDLPNVAYSTAYTLTNNTSANANIGGDLYFANTTPSVTVDYSVQRGDNYKTGTLTIAQYNTTVAYSDTFVETANVGVVLSVNMFGNIAAVQYKTTNTGIDANLKYNFTKVSWS
jgi:Major tropism determinant N-terminal domain